MVFVNTMAKESGTASCGKKRPSQARLRLLQASVTFSLVDISQCLADYHG
jgi:hypothetical protein